MWPIGPGGACTASSWARSKPSRAPDAPPSTSSRPAKCRSSSSSNWLRTVTEGDDDRRKRALEFQRTVDGLFNFRGARGEDDAAAIRLARKFREMAGFSTEEIDEIAAMAAVDRAGVASAY